MAEQHFLLNALIKKLEGEIVVAHANILVYQRNSVGIGEHGDLVETIEKEVIGFTKKNSLIIINKILIPSRNVDNLLTEP